MKTHLQFAPDREMTRSVTPACDTEKTSGKPEVFYYGGLSGVRTLDTLIKSQVLCQLS